MFSSDKPGIPVRFDGVIIRELDGGETKYSPEEWRHKELMDRLAAIEKRLEAIERAAVPR